MQTNVEKLTAVGYDLFSTHVPILRIPHTLISFTRDHDNKAAATLAFQHCGFGEASDGIVSIVLGPLKVNVSTQEDSKKGKLLRWNMRVRMLRYRLRKHTSPGDLDILCERDHDLVEHGVTPDSYRLSEVPNVWLRHLRTVTPGFPLRLPMMISVGVLYTH
ncbi:hypothetical protein CIHG_02092 [Coccidioides immitis H538.4]|uniref:Uncharacterized protein n=2 Tax=Coccidioides immitis TaxID=5501 RepID=A0A0J8RGK9_COCIT|nr:hypothetical protein CIRG_00268 [Coccidioides immitis RMSCC 2394]KMU84305.1 hypothetical protein CIHG_02092 [Coccidioides immitis H538.4]